MFTCPVVGRRPSIVTYIFSLQLDLMVETRNHRHLGLVIFNIVTWLCVDSVPH